MPTRLFFLAASVCVLATVGAFPTSLNGHGQRQPASEAAFYPAVTAEGGGGLALLSQILQENRLQPHLSHSRPRRQQHRRQQQQYSYYSPWPNSNANVGRERRRQQQQSASFGAGSSMSAADEAEMMALLQEGLGLEDELKGILGMSK